MQCNVSGITTRSTGKSVCVTAHLQLDTLKMEAQSFFETSVTRRYIPEEGNLQLHHSEALNQLVANTAARRYYQHRNTYSISSSLHTHKHVQHFVLTTHT